MTKLYSYVENLGFIEKNESEITLKHIWFKTKEEAYYNYLIRKIKKHKDKIENLEKQFKKEKNELNKTIENLNKILEKNPELSI